jgi:hypothetical protein
MTATLLDSTKIKTTPNVFVTPVVSSPKGRLVAHWLLDDNGKLYCKWFTD